MAADRGLVRGPDAQDIPFAPALSVPGSELNFYPASYRCGSIPGGDGFRVAEGSFDQGSQFLILV